VEARYKTLNMGCWALDEALSGIERSIVHRGCERRVKAGEIPAQARSGVHVCR